MIFKRLDTMFLKQKNPEQSFDSNLHESVSAGQQRFRWEPPPWNGKPAGDVPGLLLLLLMFLGPILREFLLDLNRKTRKEREKEERRRKKRRGRRFIPKWHQIKWKPKLSRSELKRIRHQAAVQRNRRKRKALWEEFREKRNTQTFEIMFFFLNHTSKMHNFPNV